MNATCFLTELDAAGVHLTRTGDDLLYETEPGVRIAAFAEHIKANKSALLAELRAREELAAKRRDPALRWVRVSTAPVEASRPPEGWNGQVPAGCSVPHACCALGPCPHHAALGRCWKIEETQ